MAKQLRSNAVRNINKPVAKKLIKSMAEKLHRSLSRHNRRFNDKTQSSYEHVPEDVKEGHFAVIAVNGDDEPRRFVVPLSCLSHPRFVRLLEMAAEEYGFSHEGALEIPCGPAELKRIIADHSNNNWAITGPTCRDDSAVVADANYWGCSFI